MIDPVIIYPRFHRSPSDPVACIRCGGVFVPSKGQRHCSLACANATRSLEIKRQGWAKRATDAQIRSAVDAANAGLSWRSAARAIGISPDGLKRRADKLGLSRRLGVQHFRKELRISLPQELTDLAYIAGLLDGEGYITISRHQRDQIKVGITNTHEPVIRWLGSFGGTVVLKGANKFGKLPCFEWRLQGRKEVYIFLSVVSPYMRIKQQKALTALATLKDWMGSDKWLNAIFSTDFINGVNSPSGFDNATLLADLTAI